VSWTLGYPEQALERSRESIALARELSKPYQLASALYFACRLRQLRREPLPARELADEVIALSTEWGFSLWMAAGMATRGWCLVEEGALEQGIKDLQLGRAQWMAIGNADRLSPPLSEGYWRAGRMDEATATIDDLFAVIERTGTGGAQEADVHRQKGELTLARNGSKADQAEASFRTAIEISRKQQTKSWELRATTSLARLFDKQGKRDEARAMLAEIYNWFTEGFDTADLKDAKALLDELNA
jgi:predicted ATPase